MNKRNLIPAAVAAIAAVVGIYFWVSGPQPQVDTRSGSSETAERPQASESSAQAPSVADTAAPTDAAKPFANADSAPPEDYEEKFHVDSSGQLVVNEKTRLHIESLVALNEPGNLEQATQSEMQKLPHGAAAKANELIDRYRTYLDAQKHSYPPGTAPADVDDAIAQLDGLHALRVAHFGAETAEAFYGEEEKLNRELFELMRLEKEPGISMEEKAVRAQAMRDKLHRVSAVEQRNREIAAAGQSGKSN